MNKSVKFSLKPEPIAATTSQTHGRIVPIFFRPRKIDAHQIWYSASDLSHIQFQNNILARQFSTGKLREGKRETHRGLERYHPEVYQHSLDVMNESKAAVLNEQILQKRMGIHDPVAIANVYRNAGARESQQTAIAMGKKDYVTSIQFRHRRIAKDNSIDDDRAPAKHFSKRKGVTASSTSRRIVQKLFH